MYPLQIENTSEKYTSIFSLLIYSLLTCSQQGFIAPLVENRTGIAEVMGSNPVKSRTIPLEAGDNFEICMGKTRFCLNITKLEYGLLLAVPLHVK